MKRKYQITAEQQAYRDTIIRRKVSSIRVRSLIPPDFKPMPTFDEFINNKLYYLNNCIYWVNEYLEGKEDIKRFSKTIKAIHAHTEEMINKINSERLKNRR